MLLKIVDASVAGISKNAVRIIFEHKDKMESFCVDSYGSPISENFRKSLTWYFNEYPLQIENNPESFTVVEKLIKFGQYMGDELLGEDHQLIKYKEIIAMQGYENLHVQIESSNIEFFKELWEVMILPESKYVLSSVVTGFVRKLVEDTGPSVYPELRFDLKVTAPSQDKIVELLQTRDAGIEENKNSSSETNNKPLRVLYVTSEIIASDKSFYGSNSINCSLEAIAAGGAIDYEIYSIIDFQQLQNRLMDKANPVHFFHYDGPIVIENEGVSILLRNSQGVATSVTVDTLTKHLVNNKVAGLCIDAREYLRNNKSISASEGLAIIAQSAHKNGLGNVIGLTETTSPWISSQCFNLMYSKITRGFTLEQAVVEARKALQANNETSLVSVKPIPFQSWPLLVHYSLQSVTFFESPQFHDSSESLQGLNVFHKKLFGFQIDMLPPLLNQVGDGNVVFVKDQMAAAKQIGKNQVVSIVGEAGSGKTQLAHVINLYFAEKNSIDYGFYFNFSNNFYSSNDMLEMLAPIFNLDINSKAETEKKLEKLHCCFVLDNICEDNSLNELAESWRELSQFLQKLALLGHKIIFLSETYSALHDLSSVQVQTTPLSLIEQKLLAASTLHRFESLDKTFNPIIVAEDWDKLLTTTNGHPWLIKKLMPLLNSFTTQELTALIDEHINSTSSNSKVEKFYEWQWASLAPIWKAVLILCSDVRGLLLEMLMTASDQKESFAPAKHFFSLLGDENAKFSTGLALWTYSGFLNYFPHGRMVDSRCLKFLDLKREEFCKNPEQKRLEFYFSQLVCEGVRLLAQHVIKQQNPAIFNNLLINRRHWVKHFENLWFSQDYQGFFAVKGVFDQLLQQAKLMTESKLWALDLLERSPTIAMIQESSLMNKLSWLSLATTVLDQSEAKNSQCIMDGAAIWHIWFATFEETDDKQQLMLFQQVTTFLEMYYQSQSNWLNAITICEKSYLIYTQHNAWQKVIQAFKSIAKYYLELGNKEQTLIYENKIIDDIPYRDAPLGFKEQQMLDVLLSRVARADTLEAQSLLDQLKMMDAVEKFSDILDGVQCDIHYLQGNYLLALPYYCKIWVRALQVNQVAQLQQLKQQLVQLEEKIGAEYFNQYFDQETPAGTIKPADYA